ncbi:2-deoxyglucose-6-phosphate phosphatase, putative [Entamoeba invadens IP1]|uniref:2-deoxyglucose-6-phosphate phosphatase, putative n=1 Tax=Entamoeba invadens IP1 TaxID=370355 RepID=A0A0A1U7A4_ENTIV|nr:2-deoxyglucose-6-phosphate phosphatase, putative [Entamoeba invadens IP1]ELP90287.1 2-deoxyglucose-6-phosphate phosphatase, putative [Entamoeba invadens IP1]|eukprot:XP_004257058.1 2-deoxyglucose-6-phosphate phosphatase, putative [Entamoeba invadens IP1]
MGRLIRESTQILLDHYHVNDTVEHAMQHKIDALEKLWPTAKPLPGAFRILKYLKSHNIPIALATSTTHAVFKQKMETQKELLSYFSAIVLGDDVKRAKPFPDIFVEAGKALGCTDMAEAVVFEDAVLGVEAGLASGAFTIAIPDFTHDIDEYFSKANLILKSLDEFKPEILGLPQDY